MKSKILPAVFSLSLLISLISCGGGSGVVNLEGPTLNLGELQQVELNQIYVKEWRGGARPFFSVYLQDALSGDYMTCVGPDQGLDVASEAGVYYGNFSLELIKIDGAKDHDTPVFNVVIVADQETPCPAPLADDDQIVGSIEVNFGQFLDLPINIGDGAAYAAFRARGHDDVDIPDMAAISEDNLTIGEMYFEDNHSEDKIPNYYAALYVSDGSSYRIYSTIYPADMPEMREPKLIYSWLMLAFSDTDGIRTDNALLGSKAYVDILKDDNELVGSTERTFLADAIAGKKINFTNGKGYLKFRKID